MPVPEGQAPPRRHGAAQRPARPRPDPLGGRRAHRRGRAQGRLRPQAARLRAVDGVPGVRGRRAARRGVRGHPARQARAAGGASCRSRTPRVVGVAARRVGGRHAAAPARCAASTGEAAAALLSARARAVRAARRRARRLPRRRAQGDRRLRGRRARTPPTRPRSTTAAARTSSRRCWPPTSPARCCCDGPCERPGADGRRRGRARVARPRRSRSSPGASATPTRRSRGRCGGPGFELQRLIGTREPDERQLEVGRAALAEILRVEIGVETPVRYPIAAILRAAMPLQSTFQ